MLKCLPGQRGAAMGRHGKHSPPLPLPLLLLLLMLLMLLPPPRGAARSCCCCVADLSPRSSTIAPSPAMNRKARPSMRTLQAGRG